MALSKEQRKNLETLDFDSLGVEDLNEALELVAASAGSEPTDDGSSHNPEFFDGEIPGEEAEVEAEEAPAKPAKAKPKAKEEAGETEKERIARIKEEKFKADAEANRWKQQYENLQRKMSEQAETKAAPMPDVDPWDTEFQRKQTAKISELDREMKYVREERQRLDAERAREQVFREAEEIAREFSLPVDIREVDADVKSLGARLQRMPTLDELASEIGNRDTAEAYFDILGAFSKKTELNYPKARAAFKDLDLDSKWSKRSNPAWMTKQSEAEGHNKTVKAVASRGKVMPSSYSGKDSSFNSEWANNWLAKKGDRIADWTAEDHQTFKKIQDKFLK